MHNDGRGVFIGLHAPSVLRGKGPSVHKMFGTTYFRPHGLTKSDQMGHDNNNNNNNNIRFNENKKISQDTHDQRPLTCDLNTNEMEKQLNYGNTTNCKRSILFNRLLKLSKDGASTTYSTT